MLPTFMGRRDAMSPKVNKSEYKEYVTSQNGMLIVQSSGRMKQSCFIYDVRQSLRPFHFSCLLLFQFCFKLFKINMQTQSPLIVFFWLHLKLRCSMMTSHKIVFPPRPSPNSIFLLQQYKRHAWRTIPACCSTFTALKFCAVETQALNFRSLCLVLAFIFCPIIFWSYRPLSPQDWLEANL